MKKMAMALLTGLLLLHGALAGAATLKVGMECNYAPFNWTQTAQSELSVPLQNGGFADGYDVQIARLVAGKLGMELQIVPMEWDGLPMALKSGRIDAIIAGMSPTAERRMEIDFTAPYYDSDLVIVVQKEGPYAGATSLADFSGARITGQLNTFHYTVIDQIPGVNKQTALENFTAMLVALSSGRIDGYVSERPGALSAVVSNPNLSFVAFEQGQGFAADAADTTVAIGLNKGSPLLEPINQVLAGLSEEARVQMMREAMQRQPLSE